MQIINLYKYQREDGGVTISPEKPDTDYTSMVRLVADEGKLITNNGKDTYTVIDVESSDGWYEIDEPTKDVDTENEND